MKLVSKLKNKIERLKKTKDDESGFTLLELIVAVGIIGILVAAGLPIYDSFEQNTRKSTGSQIARTIYQDIITAQQTGWKSIDQAGILSDAANDKNIIYVNNWTNENDLCVMVVWNAPHDTSRQNYGPTCPSL